MSIKERAKMFENNNNNNPKIQPTSKIKPNIPKKPKETVGEKPEEYKKNLFLTFIIMLRQKKYYF